MECFGTKPKSICCKILLLDEQELLHEVQDYSTGQAILDVVFSHINLIETAYFGVRYLDEFGQTHWLDPVKKLKKQLKSPGTHTLYFGVKFYAADPCKLLEEITRYQFFLQIKQDILQGRLPVPTELAAELGAYVLQSELGDYDPRVHLPGYVSEFRFLANQSLELETKIAELHKSLVGQLPSTAELNYLDRVKWLEMYGVDLHPVLGEDSVEYFLGLTPSGIIVLRNKITVGNYYWPRITKIYFKGRYFMLKVIDKNNDESTYGFETPSKSGCKHLWKCCIEHHAFFRLVQVCPTVPDIFALGSRFRYSGRTEKQALRDVQMKARVQPTFSRTPSRRFSKRNLEEYSSLHLDDVLCLNDTSSIKHISIPQPAQSNTDQNLSQSNKSLHDSRKCDSPRSTRSAPWTQPHSKGLYNNTSAASPRSIRSAGPRYRSSSVDSQSSNDSRSCKRKKGGRATSDNESELSKSSSRSHHRHRKHRSRSRKGSKSESEYSASRRNSSGKSNSNHNGNDFPYTWQEASKKISVDGNANIQQANVVHNSKLSKSDSKKTKNKKNTSNYKHYNSHAISEPKTFLSDEVKKHIDFDLIDTTGMTEKQLREIPYTVVESNANNKHSRSKHPSYRASKYNSGTKHDTYTENLLPNKNSFSSDCLNSKDYSSRNMDSPIMPEYTDSITQLKKLKIKNYSSHSLLTSGENTLNKIETLNGLKNDYDQHIYNDRFNNGVMLKNEKSYIITIPDNYELMKIKQAYKEPQSQKLLKF